MGSKVKPMAEFSFSGSTFFSFQFTINGPYCKSTLLILQQWKKKETRIQGYCLFRPEKVTFLRFTPCVKLP